MKQKLRTQSLGWIPDHPDIRDIYYSAPEPILTALPSFYDMRDKCPGIYEQSKLGSCTGNGIAAAIQFDRMKQGLENWVPSRLFIYYNERVLENSVDSDSGAMIRDGIKVVNKMGVCNESFWPYNIDQFATTPSSEAYVQSKQHPAVRYKRVPRDIQQFKASLASGYPIVVGISVYESFLGQEMANTGEMNMPYPNEKLEGGHCVVIVGYNDNAQRFIVRNSWGAKWGNAGYFTMPYDYISNSNLSDDFWQITLVL